MKTVAVNAQMKTIHKASRNLIRVRAYLRNLLTITPNGFDVKEDYKRKWISKENRHANETNRELRINMRQIATRIRQATIETHQKRVHSTVHS